MKTTRVRNQAEFDAAQARGEVPRCVGNGYFEIRTGRCRACDSSTVTAYDSSTVTACGSSTVTAYGSSTVTACDSSTVTAYDSSTVTACGSSTVTACGSSTVTAYDSSTVTAYDSSTVTACDSSTVTATDYVAVHRFGKTPKVTGGVLIQVPDIETVDVFFRYYGIKPSRAKKPTVVLYKAVNDQFLSGYRMSYAPGETPVAKDWDGGENCCGGGLHLGPTPMHASRYQSDATRFVACTVRVEDIVLIWSKGAVPDKVKCRAISKCVEVTIDGEPVK